MVVVISHFPPLKEGKDAEFLEWFSRTNKEFAPWKGLISRRLLRPEKGGNYTAVIEHESKETFLAMQHSSAHTEAAKAVVHLFNGTPSPQLYEVIVG